MEEVKHIESTSEQKVIPKYIKTEEYEKELSENNSQEEIPENKVIDIIETREKLKIASEKTEPKTFSKLNIFKHAIDEKIRNVLKTNQTIRVMLKSDYTIYPIDLPIDGKTVFFKGRRYKLDGYENRLYELQGITCIFVDVNDARPLDLSHKYSNVAYDAREFCSLFDSKGIQDLMAGIEDEKKLDKMYMISIIGLGATLLAVAILWGVIKPDWQRMIEGAVNIAQTAADQIQQSSGTDSGQVISGR